MRSIVWGRRVGVGGPRPETRRGEPRQAPRSDLAWRSQPALRLASRPPPPPVRCGPSSRWYISPTTRNFRHELRAPLSRAPRRRRAPSLRPAGRRAAVPFPLPPLAPLRARRRRWRRRCATSSCGRPTCGWSRRPSRAAATGHCLVAGDGPPPTIGLGDGAGMVRVGTAGVAARLTDAAGRVVGVARGDGHRHARIRFVVDEVTRTFRTRAARFGRCATRRRRTRRRRRRSRAR